MTEATDNNPLGPLADNSDVPLDNNNMDTTFNAYDLSPQGEEYGIPPPPAYGSVHEHDTATYDHGSGQFTNSRQGSPINSRNGGAAMELNSWKAPRASPQPMLHDMDISAAMQAPPGLSKYPTVSGDVLPMGGGISTSMMSAAGGGASMMGAELRIQVVVGTPIKLTGPSQLPGVVEYYMSYPVTIITTLPSYSAPESTVRRRFRDFVALQELIHILYPGFIIPPRPKRNAVEGRRMLPSFIEDRRASLERYLTRLGRHPVLGRCQALQLFLEYNGDLRHNSDWLRLHPANKGFISGTAKLFRQMVGKERRVLSPTDITQPSGADPLRAMRERVSSMQGVMKHAPVSVHEKQLREEAVGVEEVRLRLSHMSRCCEDLVIRISDRNHALGDLATSIMYMSKYEETRGNNLYYTEQAVSETCGQVSKLLAVSVDQTAVHLGNINDYMAYIPAVQSAFAHRERVNLTSITLELDLARAKGRMDALMAAGPAQFEKRQKCEGEVAQMESSLQTARSEYSHMCERNLEELAKWKVDMKVDLVNMLKEFTIVQVASEKKAQEMFESVVAALPPVGE